MRLITLCFSLLIAATPAFAEGLTEERVRAFYKKQEQMFSGTEVKTKYMSFIKEHTTKDSLFVLKLDSNLHEKPMNATYKGQELIEMYKGTMGSAIDLRTQIKIEDIQIDNVKNEAVVKYYMKHGGRIHSSNPSKNITVELGYDSFSGCIDALTLQNNVIKYDRGSCNMNATYERPVINRDH